MGEGVDQRHRRQQDVEVLEKGLPAGSRLLPFGQELVELRRAGAQAPEYVRAQRLGGFGDAAGDPFPSLAHLAEGNCGQHRGEQLFLGPGDVARGLRRAAAG